MTFEDKVRIVRQNFLLASEEFGFVFDSPFTLTDDLEVFGYIPNYGSKNGIIICLEGPSDYLLRDQRVIDWCREMDCTCSFLNIEFYSGEYKRSYFREMLRDWDKF